MNLRLSKNIRVVAALSVVLAFMTGLVAYSPTLYRLFCDLTGYGGTVQRTDAAAGPISTSNETVTVRFDANVGSGLAWEFRPEQREVKTRFGEPVQAYYYAKNLSSETVVGRAVFNVTPYQTAPYFFKIECFCFTNQKLEPGESARMPLVLYIDEQMLKDKDTSGFRAVTLSYTFYKQEDLSSEEVDSARNLKAGSQSLDASLENDGPAGFDNDAPRR
ncbi:cytochrome c oxidase assembly protein [Manganibacter manganicus]|uniref:Cytochrome c oxidase assembly protein CtaG n=1 Tax=Manganibacter manganicus TaxID=1873176 RepID=A0A1V8RR28_9HYPH|nr:cytochrome c oxidase assembly protein [Pseudaminobacter manganicus]OQM75660.1 cytochrome C oxidase assembly protein [Pseudaminobacter manganicus]